MRPDKIKDTIVEQWGDEPAVKLCFDIIDFIARESKQNSSMMTMGKLAEITGADARSPVLINALSILTSSLGVMAWKFVFFHDDDEPYYLDEGDVARFLSEGAFSDPRTGIDVGESPSRIYPYLEANPDILKAGQ